MVSKVGTGRQKEGREANLGLGAMTGLDQELPMGHDSIRSLLSQSLPTWLSVPRVPVWAPPGSVAQGISANTRADQGVVIESERTPLPVVETEACQGTAAPVPGKGPQPSKGELSHRSGAP